MPDCAVNDRDEHDSNEILTSNWPFNIVSKNLSLFRTTDVPITDYRPQTGIQTKIRHTP